MSTTYEKLRDMLDKLDPDSLQELYQKMLDECDGCATLCKMKGLHRELSPYSIKYTVAVVEESVTRGHFNSTHDYCILDTKANLLYSFNDIHDVETIYEMMTGDNLVKEWYGTI